MIRIRVIAPVGISFVFRKALYRIPTTLLFNNPEDAETFKIYCNGLGYRYEVVSPEGTENVEESSDEEPESKDKETEESETDNEDIEELKKKLLYTKKSDLIKIAKEQLDVDLSDMKKQEIIDLLLEEKDKWSF